VSQPRSRKQNHPGGHSQQRRPQRSEPPRDRLAGRDRSHPAIIPSQDCLLSGPDKIVSVHETQPLTPTKLPQNIHQSPDPSPSSSATRSERTAVPHQPKILVPCGHPQPTVLLAHLHPARRRFPDVSVRIDDRRLFHSYRGVGRPAAACLNRPNLSRGAPTGSSARDQKTLPANAARRRGFGGLAIGVAPCAYSRRRSGWNCQT
jgi:hypothetical protein